MPITASPAPLHESLPVHAGSLRRARSLLTAWLAAHGRHGDSADDLVYAVSEAVTNSIEHAFIDAVPGTITMDALARRTDDDLVEVQVTVTDTGRWRAPPADPGTRGRGLFMMNRLVDNFQIAVTDTGTRVHISSNL